MKNLKFECLSDVVGAGGSIPPEDIDIVQKSIKGLLPKLNLSREDVSAAISGLRVPNIEKYLDIDILELAKAEEIPAIFFHLVIGELKGARLSNKSSNFLKRAKVALNNLDGNIYASDTDLDNAKTKKKKIQNTKKMLFDAADRVLSRETSLSSASKGNWSNLKKADKKLKVYLRIDSFVRKITKLFKPRKFSSTGTTLYCQRFKQDSIILDSNKLTKLEKEFGMIRTLEDDKITWLLVPSVLYFTSNSNESKYGKLSPLISLILKLDPKAIITKVGKLLKVFSAKLKSSRLDGAFEMVGKKCGATWKGRIGDDKDTLVWQTLHVLS